MMARRRDVNPVLDFLRGRGIEPELRNGSKHLLLIFTVNGRRHMLPFSHGGETDQWGRMKKLADLKRILGV
jgi:hypothetical protein